MESLQFSSSLPQIRQEVVQLTEQLAWHEIVVITSNMAKARLGKV